MPDKRDCYVHVLLIRSRDWQLQVITRKLTSTRLLKLIDLLYRNNKLYDFRIHSLNAWARKVIERIHPHDISLSAVRADVAVEYITTLLRSKREFSLAELRAYFTDVDVRHLIRTTGPEGFITPEDKILLDQTRPLINRKMQSRLATREKEKGDAS
jgi:hypothetical protein